MILNNLNWSKIPRYIPTYPNRCPGAPVFPPQETKDATKPVDFAIDPAAPLKIEEESTTVSWRFVAFAKWFWGVPFGITVYRYRIYGFMDDEWLIESSNMDDLWMIYGPCMNGLWSMNGIFMDHWCHPWHCPFWWVVSSIPKMIGLLLGLPHLYGIFMDFWLME